MESKIPGQRITFIIRDDAPLIHCNDSSAYRRVTIDLTPDQIESIRLNATATSMGKPVFGSVSKCFIE
jgi:hypothetical protein